MNRAILVFNYTYTPPVSIRQTAITITQYHVSLIPQPPQPFAGPTYPPVLLQLVKALLWPPHHERGRKLEYSSNEQIPDVDPVLNINIKPHISVFS